MIEYIKMDRAIIAWIALGLIWGSNFIFMKWATELISPGQVVLIRVVVGCIPVLCFAFFTNQLRLQHLRHIPHFLVMACLAAALYYYGFAKGTSLLPSGIAGAVSGAIPLFSIVAALLFLPDEGISKNRIVGIIVGFIGVLIIARPFQEVLSGDFVEGVAYMILGSFSLGISFVYARKFVVPLNIPAPALVTYQLVLAAVVLSAFTDFNGVTRIIDEPLAVWSLIVGLGFLGTGIAYILYYYIISSLGAVASSSVTYLPPIVALTIGGLFLQENIEIRDYMATMMIFLGVFLVNKQSASSKPAMKSKLCVKRT